jgi:dynein heavy chain
LTFVGSLKRSDEGLGEHLVLIRALRDSNFPKLLADDIPLFNGIIQDLFPGINIPSIDYGNLQLAIEAEIIFQKLEPLSSFVTKVIQLYDTMIVRHGVMLVGDSGFILFQIN